MKLSQIDADKCYDLLTGLDFLAIEYYNIKKARTENHTTSQILSIRKRWQNSDNKHFIESFIHYAKLNDEDANIVRSWTYLTRNTYIIQSQTPERTVIETLSGQKFGVLGLGQEISSLLNTPMPILSKMIILPYNDSLTIDGIMETIPLNEKELEEIYNYRKIANLIHPE